jgi:hypothetical protein
MPIYSEHGDFQAFQPEVYFFFVRVNNLGKDAKMLRRF